MRLPESPENRRDHEPIHRMALEAQQSNDARPEQVAGTVPAVPLILTHKRTRHELNVKRPVNDDGETFKHLAVDSLQHDVTGLYRAAGFGRGISSHPRCRTFANRLIAQRHSIETVQSLLGHIHLDHFAPYLKISKKARRKAMADLDGFFADA